MPHPWLLLLLILGPPARADDPPRVVDVCTVAPTLLAVTIEAGRVELGDQVPYQPRPGDTEQKEVKAARWGWLVREGKPIGGRVGPRGDLLQTFDRLVGEPLDLAYAETPATYSLTCADDEQYRAPRPPLAVMRKSKPSGVARVGPWEFKAPVRHVLYLRLPAPLQAGKQYRLSFASDRLAPVVFTHDPATRRSEAVHVSQVGFRPDDPVKVAFLSCWLGRGGGLSYPVGTPFRVLDDATGKVVFEGKAAPSRLAAEPEDVYRRNYNGTDVYALDFTPLNQEGTYRVWVEGVGCSYPFALSRQAWDRSFRVSARGFYHQRSGIALGPPFTDYRRPRCYHPEDGVKVFASTCSLMDSGNGLNARGTDRDNFGNLVAGKTEEIVPDAWGGYCDAGDWDRRIQHLEATRLLLELVELFPQFSARADLNIPESGSGLPDLVSEALWNLDCYRRMQRPDGGIRGGIESAADTQFGEGSWQNSLDVMAYAPDLWCGFVYAGDAARAAGALSRLKSERAEVYRASALRAMEWAEAQWNRTGAAGLAHEVWDARNLAAVELFRLTGDPRWHAVFMTTTVFRDPGAELYEWQKHDQRDACFVYAHLQRDGLDPQVRANCRAAILRVADMSAGVAASTAFGWAKGLNAYQPPSWGVLGVPQAVNLVRAHWLTGDVKYLAAAVRACQYGAGANPMNLCLTTGVGQAWPLGALVVDARVSHQPPPPGITLYGPCDTTGTEGHWLLKRLRSCFQPPPEQWPTTEAYFDLYLYPQVCEFTVNGTIGPNAYVWGYLAAR